MFEELGGIIIDFDGLGPVNVINGIRERSLGRYVPRENTIRLYQGAELQDLAEKLCHFRQALRDGVIYDETIPAATKEIWEGQVDTLYRSLGLKPIP